MGPSINPGVSPSANTPPNRSDDAAADLPKLDREWLAQHEFNIRKKLALVQTRVDQFRQNSQQSVEGQRAYHAQLAQNNAQGAQSALDQLRRQLAMLRDELPQPMVLMADGADDDESIFKFCDGVIDTIKASQANNKVFSDIVQRFTAFYKRVSEFDYSKYVAAADGDGKREVSGWTMGNDFSDLLTTGVPDSTGSSRPIFLGQFDTKDEAIAMAKKMFGANWQQNLKIEDGNKLVVMIDRGSGSTIGSLRDLMYKAENANMDNAEFAAFQQQYNTAMSSLQQDNQSLITQLSNDNNVMDNVIKTMTGSIEKLFDMLKQFLRF